MNNDKRIITRIVGTAKTLILGGLLAMTCACNDFLTIYPTDKIVLEDFWKSKDDVESVVAESYRLMTQKDFTNRLLVWGELRGDNVIEGNNVPTDIKNILEANILPSNSYTSWSIFYQVINNCNIVLKYAPGVLNEDPDFTQGDLDVVCGQMYAIRALCHFYLVRTFRDIPLLTEAMVDNSQNLYQEQVSPIEALDCCLDDLKKAEGLVLTSGNYQSEADNKGRITKDAVRAMIADVLLWKAAFATNDPEGDAEEVQGCYNECIAYCDKVLDARMAYIKVKQNEDKNLIYRMTLNNSLPILYPSERYDGYATSPKENTGRFPHYPYFELFAGGCNSLCESIFEIQHATNKETGNYEVPYFYGRSNDKGKSFTVGVLSASRYLALLSNGLYSRTDFRRVGNVFSQSEGGKDLDKYGIIKYGYLSSSEDRTGLKTDNSDVYTFGKISYTFLDNGGKDYFDNNQVNWIVYRISDVILMKAEALALRNNNDGADLTAAFNLVRTVYDRSQSGYKDAEGNIWGDAQFSDFFDKKFEIAKSNSQEMVKLVLDERQREFAFEGKRWFDLVRMALRSKDGTSKEMLDIMVNHKYTSNQDQYRTKMSTISSLFFPISEREIHTHPGLEQNEAYKTEESVEKN